MPPISLLILDVDGVLTDGGIYVASDGSELKRFQVADGLALRVWAKLGLKSAIITGRSGEVVLHRMADLNVSEVIQGSKDKATALTDVVRSTGADLAHTAYLGDDWPDLPALKRVAYPMAVSNAAPQVKKLAKYVTSAPGGHGAVREAIEHLLVRNNLMDRALSLYDGTDGR